MARQIGIARITQSGIWTIDDDGSTIKQWMGDLRTSKGALWIHRYDLAGKVVSVYLVKRRSRYVRMKDYFISGWVRHEWEFVLAQVAVALVSVWMLTSILWLWSILHTNN